MDNYKNYINLIRQILKIFDEFDDVIIRTVPKIFDDYYLNRNNKIYNIDNLFKKYDIIRYNLLNKKYNLTKNEKLIFRFNKKQYIINLLKKKNIPLQNYKELAEDILKRDNIDCYSKFINEKYLDKYNLDEAKLQQEDSKKDLTKKIICFYPPCLNYVTNDNYCCYHNKYLL